MKKLSTQQLHEIQPIMSVLEILLDVVGEGACGDNENRTVRQAMRGGAQNHARCQTGQQGVSNPRAFSNAFDLIRDVIIKKSYGN